MSRKKHNISYIKPDEPKFLRELKEQIGYKEGPTVDTKVRICELLAMYLTSAIFLIPIICLQLISNIKNKIKLKIYLNNLLNQREALPEISDDEKEELTDEKPVVVVLNSGDLTAEEADAFKKQKDKGVETMQGLS